MKQKVLETIKKYNLIQNGDKIVLGVSGGPDSISMLDILNEIRIDKTNNLDFNIVVAHVNHMIREEAGEDLEFVKKFCNKIGVEFYSKSIDIQKIANTNKIGTEEAGRNARYEFFDEILEKENANKIAIAHNKNDKIESFQWICKQNQNCTRNCSDIRSKEWNYICHSYDHADQHCIWHIQNCQANKAQQTDNC